MHHPICLEIDYLHPRVVTNNLDERACIFGRRERVESGWVGLFEHKDGRINVVSKVEGKRMVGTVGYLEEQKKYIALDRPPMDVQSQ